MKRTDKKEVMAFDKARNRRKILLINPRFQIRFLANMVFLTLAICAIFYMAQSYFFWKAYEIGKNIGLEPDHVFFRFIREQQHSMNILLIGTSVTAAIFIFVFGLYYSHKIAGPLYHLNKYLRGKVSGESKYVLKFRDGDYFTELAEATNLYVQSQERPASKRKKSA